MGVMGTLWVTLVFIIWGITFGWKQRQYHGSLANLWIIGLIPVWIAIFFNPTRILGVILLKIIRESSDPTLERLLISSMRALNLIPIIVFFFIIPTGLLQSKSDKFRKWWLIFVSAMTFFFILVILFFNLISSVSVYSYSITDQSMFILMAIQIWLPIAIVTFAKIRDSARN